MYGTEARPERTPLRAVAAALGPAEAFFPEKSPFAVDKRR